ncbi:hypothetical protein OUZ56_001177 [Daphnia magna]|uniref:Uncharacterized protein n=1 Tax=Daphnia magna TaxID=35525 RepID=A0ABR0A2J7_9CRUS|nr:hypothetical protein OUZ56_001177 [Daphnia magna]
MASLSVSPVSLILVTAHPTYIKSSCQIGPSRLADETSGTAEPANDGGVVASRDQKKKTIQNVNSSFLDLKLEHAAISDNLVVGQNE